MTIEIEIDALAAMSEPAAASASSLSGAGAAAWPWRRARRSSRLPVLLVATDVSACVVGLATPMGRFVGAWAIAFVVIVSTAHLYRPRLALSLLDDLVPLVRCTLSATCLVIVGMVAGGRDHVARTLVASLVVLLPTILMTRFLTYSCVRFARRHRWVNGRALVVGSTELSRHIAEELRQRPEYGMLPVGFLDETTDEPHDLPLFGRLQALPRLVSEHAVSTLIVAGPAARDAEVVDVVRACTGLDLEIFVVPRLYQVFSGAQLELVGGIPLVRLRRLAMRSSTWLLKRAMDVVLSALGLVLTAPVIGIAALAVRWEIGPDVIFRQERVGRSGRTFNLFKLRSLRPTPDADQATTWSIADNPAVGPVGRLLRSTSIDELPQLWNVLRGDMSLVGPRPERPHFVSQFSDEHEDYPWRHRVPCGLSGWAQVNGLRGNTSIADRARFDNYYIENWSLGLDIRILLRTFAAVVRRAGA